MNLLGASCLGDGRCRFTVCAPAAKKVEVCLLGPSSRVVPLTKDERGLHAAIVDRVSPGELYLFRLDGQKEFPDPASRYQPQGVHGPSQVVDPSTFPWSDSGWKGGALEDMVVYELQVGTFTSEGTFAAAKERLHYLKNLGITAVELMPVADFPGRRGWGYDGVSLFAPARCYGDPDDLRRLVDAAHRLGISIFLDVVYNHLGPDGNYLGAYFPRLFTERHHTPWGNAINFDGEGSSDVRSFFIESASRWITEYHIDGLRFDATHAIIDDSPRHIMAEMSSCVRQAAMGRRIVFVAEDHRNMAAIVKPESEGGWGFDAIWSDDFHHEVRRLLAGDQDGYYRDYTGSIKDLADTIRQGWFYKGQHSEFFGGPRGTDPEGLSPQSRVFFVQNHDQIGNRALGERLHHQIDIAAYRAVTTLLFCCPETPLLFMGQEWAASSPFLFFTDHHPELGKRVTEGRRSEFKRFSSFASPEARNSIPDPQTESTFNKSKLDWGEIEREPHAVVLRLYQALLLLRRTEPALRSITGHKTVVEVLQDSSILLKREPSDTAAVLAIIRLKGAGRADLSAPASFRHRPGRRWDVILSTEELRFSPHPMEPKVDLAGVAPFVEFTRPGAVILKEVSV